MNLLNIIIAGFCLKVKGYKVNNLNVKLKRSIKN